MKTFRTTLLCLSMVCTTASGGEERFSIFGDALLRYEDETQHIDIADRERLRLIARLGAHYQLNQTWAVTARLRTGLKNRQNVPAITIHKFTDQPTPDSDIFVDQLFVAGKWHNSRLQAGKIPWSSWQNTDMFWDRDLNPVGFHFAHQVNKDTKASVMVANPLDGNNDTIGTIVVAQWQQSYQWQDWQFKIAPWYVSYSGEEGAEFATRDTQIDNQFFRIALNARNNNWSFGLDMGRSLESFDATQFGGFTDDKNAYAAEIKYGGLKQTGDYQAHIRYLHIERFGVITEFAQNATQRFGTNDVKGWDLRLRRKMAYNWWLGTRFSKMERITGNEEEGNRFRVETQYRF